MMDPRMHLGKLTPCTFNAPDIDQPKRPLSAYNIFFQVERQRLISDKPESGPYSRAEVYSICLDKATRIEKSKRPHRKMHGMISFTDLAKTIAQKWKELDTAGKKLFEERADDEKRKYAVELEEWLLRQAPTQQVKKRLSALRRGSLSKYISGREVTASPNPTASLPTYVDNAIHHVNQVQTPSRSLVPSPSPQVTPAPNHVASPGRPGRREIQMQRARNLQRLYQMQIQLYNEQMRLHAECNADFAASYESEPFHPTHHHTPDVTPEIPPGVSLHDTPHYVSSDNLWDQGRDNYAGQGGHVHYYPDHHSQLPVQSPFHEEGRVSPYPEVGAFL